MLIISCHQFSIQLFDKNNLDLYLTFHFILAFFIVKSGSISLIISNFHGNVTENRKKEMQLFSMSV